MPVRALVYRLQPTAAQHNALQTILENQRILYNAALQERRDSWSKAGISIGLNNQTKSLTKIRRFDDAYGGIPYNLSKWTLKRVDDAFKGLFRRIKSGSKAGFPRYRVKTRWASFGFHQTDGLRFQNGKLFFSSGVIGGLKICQHRPLPDGAKIKSAVFTLELGIWRVSLSCEIPTQTDNNNATIIGIDVGVNHLATDSNGRQYDNIRSQAKMSRKMRIAQRAVARRRKGSKSRLKAIAKLQRLKRKERNCRTTHMHNVANAIVRSGPTIIVEDLKLRNITKSTKGALAKPRRNLRQKAGLNRVLQDAALGRLISMIDYKAESAGGRMIKVDPRNTSRTCSNCGIIEATQAGRTFDRSQCGHVQHRDHNAAINIRLRGIEILHEAARRLGEPNVGGCAVRALRNTEPLAA